MNISSRILIVGHDDVIERSLAEYFKAHQFKSIFSASGIRLNTLDQSQVRKFFAEERPEYVFLASVRSGGIAANQKFAAEFIYENLESQNNLIHESYRVGVKKLLYFNGSCAYPKNCPQPMKEESLLTGPLEETSEPYSIAKIAGTKLCQAYQKQYGFNAIVAVPATIYGPDSDTELETAHVIGALIGKFYEAVVNNAQEIVVWGSGRPRREFLFADDFVSACLFLMEHYDEKEMINVGCGEDVSIKELALLIKEASGFKGKIVFDRARPDGTMRKLMDSRRLAKAGWKAKVSLQEGVYKTYQWYKQQREKR